MTVEQDATGHPVAESLVVAVCTLHRPYELARLLSALAGQRWPEGASVLIVDNDPGMSAQSVVETSRNSIEVPIDYVVEPRRGFATVRNRALDEVDDTAAVVFLDDDAVVPPDWVAVLAKTRDQYAGYLVRSRYAHVAWVPQEPTAVAAAVAALAPLEAHGPAGTSGLLLPAKLRTGLRFDPYFDHSGGEDVHLLATLADRGIPSVLAPTLVLEGARSQALSRAQQAELARWNGRMTMAVMQRVGQPTLRRRLHCAAWAVPAVMRGLVRQVSGRPDAATGHFAYASNLWAQASAPRRVPASLGTRPAF
jgi:hypothetical protein